MALPRVWHGATVVTSAMSGLRPAIWTVLVKTCRSTLTRQQTFGHEVQVMQYLPVLAFHHAEVVAP